MKNVIHAANLILLTLIAGLSVEFFYTFIAYSYSSSEVSPEVQADADAPESRKNHPLTYYQTIVGRDLFKTGKTVDSAPVLSEPAEDLEVTDLNIKLWGTVTGHGLNNYAVIETVAGGRSKAQELFRQGDAVASATIEKILPDKVILNQNGTRQVLMLEIFRGAAGTRRTASSRIARPTRTQRRTISRRALEGAVGNINQLLSQARIVPDQRGMRIAAIKPGSLFRRLGLRNGDVITGVNGRALHSMDDAMSLYQNLKNGDAVSIQLIRRNRPQTFQYRVR